MVTVCWSILHSEVQPLALHVLVKNHVPLLKLRMGIMYTIGDMMRQISIEVSFRFIELVVYHLHNM